MKINGPLLFVILDGWGVREERDFNAISHAHTPFWDYVSGANSDPELPGALGPVSYTTLVAVGPQVGMPQGAKGSTAVGHEVLSGVDYRHPMSLIEESIQDDVMHSQVVDEAIDYALEHGSAFHLMGLISDNREHSDIRHLYAILKRAVQMGQKKIRLHFFSDGRGTPPQSGPRFVKELRSKIAEITQSDPAFDIKIATVGGRDLTMNRSTQYWTKSVSVLRAIFEAAAPRVETIDQAFEAAYKLGLNDQYVQVGVVDDYTGIGDYDSLLHFNFRRDRTEMLMRLMLESEEDIARMLCESGDSTFAGLKDFHRIEKQDGPDYTTLKISALVEYYKNIPCPVAFRAKEHKWTLGRFLDEMGYRQRLISGVDKTAALRLLNGAEREQLYSSQQSILVPLPQELADYIAAYDVNKGLPGFEENPYVKFPLVELEELTHTIVRELAAADEKTLLAVNVCNPDMVGHTGDMAACVKCVEAIDPALRTMAEAVLAAGGAMVITADHGNIEEICSGGEPNTYHTRAKVPFAIIGLEKIALRNDGTLKDVAPTLLYLLNGEERPEIRRHLVGRILMKAGE